MRVNLFSPHSCPTADLVKSNNHHRWGARCHDRIQILTETWLTWMLTLATIVLALTLNLGHLPWRERNYQWRTFQYKTWKNTWGVLYWAVKVSNRSSEVKSLAGYWQKATRLIGLCCVQLWMCYVKWIPGCQYGDLSISFHWPLKVLQLKTIWCFVCVCNLEAVSKMTDFLGEGAASNFAYANVSKPSLFNQNEFFAIYD